MGVNEFARTTKNRRMLLVGREWKKMEGELGPTSKKRGWEGGQGNEGK